MTGETKAANGKIQSIRFLICLENIKKNWFIQW